MLLAAGIQGYALVRLNLFARVLMAGAGVLLIAPGWMFPAVGVGLCIAGLSLSHFQAPRASLAGED